MAFFRNITQNILSSRHERVDIDMEADNNHSDVELNEMETSSGSTHYPQPAVHYPHSPNSDNTSTFPQTALPSPVALLPPFQISSKTLNIKRSYIEDRTDRVRVVE